jgi:hypothetical protein
MLPVSLVLIHRTSKRGMSASLVML